MDPTLLEPMEPIFFNIEDGKDKERFKNIRTSKRKDWIFAEITNDNGIQFGDSVFSDHNGVVLANIDQVYKFTDTKTTPFSFLIIDGTDGYVEYITWRMLPDPDLMSGYYDGGEYDYYNPSLFVPFVAQRGMNLVIMPHTACQRGLSTMKIGGTAIVDIGNNVSEQSDLLWALANQFKKISVITPVSGNTTFCVCIGYNVDKSWLRLIGQSFDYIAAFEMWILDICTKLQENDKVIEYDVNQCFKIWNIPYSNTLIPVMNPIVAEYSMYFKTDAERWHVFIVQNWSTMLDKMSSTPALLDVMCDKQENSVLLKVYGTSIVMPRITYDYLYSQMIVKRDEYAAYLSVIWKLLGLQPSSKHIDVARSLVNTKYQIKTDLVSFPTNAVCSKFYGVFDMDKNFGAKGKFIDVKLRSGVFMMNLLQFKKDLQEKLIAVLKEKLKPDYAQKAIIILLCTASVVPLETMYLGSLENNVHIISKGYGQDIVDEIKTISVHSLAHQMSLVKQIRRSLEV